MKPQNGVSTPNRVTPWPGRGTLRSVLLVTATLLAAGLAIAFFGHELERHISAIEGWVAHLGWVGMLAFTLLVVAALCLFMPETLFSVAAGVLFGLWWGVAIIFTANVLAGSLEYGLAYRLLREPIRRKLGASKMANVIDRVANEGNFRLQALLRLAPVHQAIVSYLLGAAGVRFRQFLLALVAMLPAIILEVYLGHAGKHLAMISTGIKQSGWQHDALLFGGLLVIIVAVGLASRSAYNVLLRATKEAE